MQGIFLTQGSNPCLWRLLCLLHLQAGSLPLGPPGKSINSCTALYKFKVNRASLVAQLVKNLPAMRETWVWSLVWKDPLEKGKATYSSILAWWIPWTTFHEVAKRRTHWATFTFSFLILIHPSIHLFTHQFNKYPTILELCWVPDIQWWVRQDSSSVSADVRTVSTVELSAGWKESQESLPTKEGRSAQPSDRSVTVIRKGLWEHL